MIVWNGKKAEVHEVGEGAVAQVSSFECKAKSCVLNREDIFTLAGGRVEVCTLTGAVKRVIAFTDTEGTPTALALNNDCFAVATSSNMIKMWDVSRREPKSLVSGRVFDGVGLIKSLKINSKATKISFITSQPDPDTGMLMPDTRVFVYDVDADKLESYNCGPAFYPIAHFWDPNEPKLIAVHTRRFETSAVVTSVGSSASAGSSSAAGADEYKSGDGSAAADVSDDDVRKSEGEIVTLFATVDCGVLLQDSFACPSSETLLGLEVPNLQFLSRPNDESKGAALIPKVKSRTLRDFVGLESLDESAKADLINFSYYLTIGNMDEAFRAVKKIQTSTLWENMARMCVKTKRLDVAEVCLGNMGHATGAAAVRQAKVEPERDAAVAMLAVQLGLMEEAEALYQGCGRHDLLVKMYMAWGRWDPALNVAEKHDRIHLKAVCYQYARHLEGAGDIKNAITFYERSGTQRREVPRMLMAANLSVELEQYIHTSDDPDLMSWLAAYAESRQQYDLAVQHYTTAKDWVSVCRVHCFQGAVDKASELCIDTNDPSACYTLARHFEMNEQIKDAVQFYARAHRYNHAVRLAKQHNMINEILTMALESNNTHLQCDAGHWLETRQHYDKAVLLYRKGGATARALELCFSAELYDSLRLIADELGNDSDPALLRRCGDFFLQHHQYDKAVGLLVSGNQVNKALDICTQFQAKLTEEIADKMTAEKLGPDASEEEKENRNNLLKRIGKIAKEQGNYLLACKKYSNAGDKVRAIKCLIKHGDTEKIIYYATHTKKPEIYLLAATFLQNLDWHNEPEIMKAIIKFYTAAGAMIQLADFYEACAQVEVDDYRDYEKALLALKESLKYIIKAKAVPNKEEKLASLDQRIRLVERFVEGRKAVKTDPSEMIKICNQLLELSDIEHAIRVGDVFALLIEYFYAQATPHAFQQAFNLIERMRDRNIILTPYLDQVYVEAQQ